MMCYVLALRDTPLGCASLRALKKSMNFLDSDVATTQRVLQRRLAAALSLVGDRFHRLPDLLTEWVDGF